MSATADLFDKGAGSSRSALCALKGGDVLYRHGEAADAVFLVRSGLLVVLREDALRAPRVVGYVRSGECVGEMGVLAGTPRSATVVALRDSVIDAMPAAMFLTTLEARPHVAAELAQLVARRAQSALGSLALDTRARVVLVSGTMPGASARALAQQLAACCHAAGQPAVMLDRNSIQDDPAIVELAEASNMLVLLAAERDELEWATHCWRQADRVLLLGRSDEEPPRDCAMCVTEPLQKHQLVDLVLTREVGSRPVSGNSWLAATSAARLYHVDDGGGGIARLARILTGTSIALVLSGGGARAFAHIGAVRMLREKGVLIDLVGGTSMGAIIAAGVAAGWDDTELDERMRAAFVSSSPLDDFALPIVAMTRGRKVEARLREHFGDVDIADLNLPYFCMSADLTSGHHRTHDRGSLVRALRASISLPGVLPPVVEDGHVLVDGGLLRNLPTDIMRARHDGTVIGSDVTRAAGLEAADVMPPTSWWRWWGTGAWRRGPPIVSILMRSGTIGTSAEIAAARAAADLYVMPDTGMVEIRDWRAYLQAVEAGHAAMQAALAGLDMPVADLRRRRGADAR